MANFISSTQDPFNMNQKNSFSFGPTNNQGTNTSTPSTNTGGSLWGSFLGGLGNAWNTVSGMFGGSNTASAADALGPQAPGTSKYTTPGYNTTNQPTGSAGGTNYYNNYQPTDIYGKSLPNYIGYTNTTGKTNPVNMNSPFNNPNVSANAPYAANQPGYYAGGGLGYTNIGSPLGNPYTSYYGGGSGGFAPAPLTPQEKANAGIQYTNTSPGSLNLSGIQNNVTTGATPDVQNRQAGLSVMTSPTGTGPTTGIGGVMGDQYGGGGYTGTITRKWTGSDGQQYGTDSQGNIINLSSGQNINDMNNTGQSGQSGQGGLFSQFLNNLQNTLGGINTNLAQSNQSYGTAQDQYNQKAQALADFEKANANQIAAIQGNPNLSLDTQQGKAQVINNQFASALPAYQGAVTNANQNIQNALNMRNQDITQQGNVLNALQGGAGLATPRQNGYVLMDPSTGQPIGGGNVGSAAFRGGQIDQQQTQGGAYQSNKESLSAAQSMTQGLLNGIQSAGINSHDVNLFNSIVNAFKTNTSGPYPQIQTMFNNAIAQYAKILGPQMINPLQASANGMSMAQYFNTLNNLAQSVQGATYNAGTGSNNYPINTNQFGGQPGQGNTSGGQYNW